MALTMRLECEKCGRTDGRQLERAEWLRLFERDGWHRLEDGQLWCRYCYEG